MNTKHKWYDVIVAWANGEKIQFRGSDEFTLVYNEPPNKEWKDFNGGAPNWAGIEWEWRVKPKMITKKYRMALFKDGGVGAYEVSKSTIDDPIEYSMVGFIRWIGDTVEVEVEIEV